MTSGEHGSWNLIETEINFEKQFDYIEQSNKKFDEILDQMSALVEKILPSEMPKFTGPTSLQDGDYVVIRYVESPTLFSVQLTKSIAEYDVMMDRLCDYCLSAPTIRNTRIGMACAAYYENDSEWYRAEILDIGRGQAITRFVDYGVELTIEISQLKEIGSDFLLMPKQAIPCCILGFESLQATKTVTDKLEFLAERSSGERRKFRVSTHGRVNGIPLVNLVDTTASPVLDLSMRLLQLSLPQDKFREYAQKVQRKSKSSTPSSTLPIPSDCGASSRNSLFANNEVVGRTLHDTNRAVTNVDESWMNLVNRHYYRIDQTVQEHLARQLYWQILFSYHMSQINNILRISLQWRDCGFSNVLNRTPVDSRGERAPKAANNNVQMQMIRNHLGVRQGKVPQNMPTYNPNITPPSMDFNWNHVEKAQQPPASTVIPTEQPTFVQYCELNINGQSMLNCVKDTVNQIPKFLEPVALSECDFVVIRYVESPKMFCVQQTKNIVAHNTMIDQLCHYCLTAPPLSKYEKGVACAARYKNDSEWYRAEIVSVSGSNAMIRFVDYGIELQTEIATLKEIHYDFLKAPKQAVQCCLLGFETMLSQTVSSLSQHRMDLLAEDSLGQRRNFKVKIHGNADDIVLVNLIDETQLPHLNFSLRMLQLNSKQSLFRQHRSTASKPYRALNEEI